MSYLVLHYFSNPTFPGFLVPYSLPKPSHQPSVSQIPVNKQGINKSSLAILSYVKNYIIPNYCNLQL